MIKKIAIFLCFLGTFVMISSRVHAGKMARLKDIASIKGVRENILIGYGVVVGLKGTGDSSVDITSSSLQRLFGKLGLETGNEKIKSKNAAAVIVTAKLPAFARVGKKIDVTVSSIGDAKSLEGGVLLVTPLRGGDQNVYAVAQGTLSLGSTIAGGSSKDSFPTVARVISGATIEKDIVSNFAEKRSIRLALSHPDFTTAARLAKTINGELGGKYATAVDSGTLDIIVPFHYVGQTVELLAILENMQVAMDTKAKVVLNERTGTVVLGGEVVITPVAISHGDLSIEIKDENAGSKKENIMRTSDQGSSVADMVKALNGLGVKPKDLTAILQTLREVGALQADLNIM